MPRKVGDINKSKKFALEIFNLDDQLWHQKDTYNTLNDIAKYLNLNYSIIVNIKRKRSKQLNKIYRINIVK